MRVAAEDGLCANDRRILWVGILPHPIFVLATWKIGMPSPKTGEGAKLFRTQRVKVFSSTLLSTRHSAPGSFVWNAHYARPCVPKLLRRYGISSIGYDQKVMSFLLSWASPHLRSCNLNVWNAPLRSGRGELIFLVLSEWKFCLYTLSGSFLWNAHYARGIPSIAHDSKVMNSLSLN
jgi:hypothetical protein